MDRNLRLYPLWQVSRGLLFWLPVFFLYFSSVLPLADVLRLEAIYYLAVVALEVPSGYFSDRVGRKPTLAISALSTAAACALFATTSSLLPFALAQVLLAAGMAFNSGTDSSLLYDSLVATGRRRELAEREGRAQSWGLFAMGIASLVGGALAGFDLRIAYVLTGVSAAAGFFVAMAFQEPPSLGDDGGAAAPVATQLRRVVGRLTDPGLRWVFAFAVGMTVFNHVPYELFQPYLELLLADFARPDYALTPGVAGVFGAVMLGISVVASRRSARLGARFGARRVLLFAVLVQGGVMAAMAVALHPIVLLPMLLRSVPGAVTAPLVAAEVHPRLTSGLRATYLSVQSLAGRLAFSATLFLAALAVGEATVPTHSSMRELLLGYEVALVGLVLFLGWTGRGALNRLRERRPPR